MDKFIFTNPQSDLEGSIICQLEEAGLEKALEDLIQLYSQGDHELMTTVIQQAEQILAEYIHSEETINDGHQLI